jgi:serine/threonine protein kinase
MLICPQCKTLYPDTERICARDNVPLRDPHDVVGQNEPAKTLFGGVVGNYRILDRLGEGGMGVVYEAMHLSIQKLVAVKVIHKEKAKDEEAFERFFQEARAIAKLESNHIVQILDFGATQDGRPYLVMERLNGKPLPSETKLPLARAVHIAKQVCKGLAAAHAQKIVHRDLKPDNIFLVNQDGAADLVKLLDFGIAFQLPEEDNEDAKRITSESFVMGTPLYMSPEQARGHVDSRSDIYSLGVILYEMVTGKVPFDGSNSADILVKHLTQRPTPPSLLVPEISAALEDSILKAMTKDVGSRYQKIEDLLAALEAVETITKAEKTQEDLGAYNKASAKEVRRNPPPDNAKTIENKRLQAFSVPLPVLIVGVFLFVLLLTYFVISLQ